MWVLLLIFILALRALLERLGLKVGCIGEIAFEQGFINLEQLGQIAQLVLKSGYGSYNNNLIT